MTPAAVLQYWTLLCGCQGSLTIPALVDMLSKEF
jgi:hypothetical protein